MSAHIRLEDQILYADSSRPVAIEARLGLKDLEYAASAQFSDTELSPYFALAGMNDLSGTLSARLEASGDARNVRQTQAAISIAKLTVRRGDLLLASAKGLEGAFEKGTLNLSGARISLLEEGYLDLSAETGLDGDLDVDAAGRIPLRAVGGFLPRIQEPAGLIALEAEMTGPVSGPSVSARVTLEDVGFTVSETLQKVEGVNGRIEVSRDSAVVKSLEGNLGQGEFSLSGRMELAQFSPQKADISLNARALPLVVPDMLEAQVNLDLAFSGSPAESSLKGDVVLLEGRYYKDINLSLIETASRIGERRRETEPISPGQNLDVPFLRNLTLDLSISSRQAFLVDNNLALMRIRPTLRVKGSLESPSVTGRAEVREGTITYRNTEFDIKKGVIDFVNPYRIEPTIDIAAEATVRQWVITLLVSGTPDNLDFRLTSDPSESDADIISLLAVGKTTGELTAGGGGAGRTPEEMLANVVAGRLAERVKEGTGLDIVEFEYRGEREGEDGTEGVRVMVGKELSRRLTVKYGVERKSGVVVQQSTAIYKLLENLAVNAYQDTEGTFGGEVRYRLEFR
jgi:autotransporter translocation and assembly factor TamB